MQQQLQNHDYPSDWATMFSANPSGPHQRVPASQPLLLCLGRHDVEKGASGLLFQADNKQALTEQMLCPGNRKVFPDQRLFAAETVAGIRDGYNAGAHISMLQAVLQEEAH